jgi:hypothetical protein
MPTYTSDITIMTIRVLTGNERSLTTKYAITPTRPINRAIIR